MLSLTLTFLTLSLFLTSLVTDSATHWDDTQLLKELKNNLNAASVTPGSCIYSWDFSFDPCDNLFSDKFTCGFRCDAVVSGTSRLTELTLDPAGYTGTLPAAWNLPYLQTLDVSNNFFSGQIPESFSNLTRLTRLGLSKNSLTGTIPSSLSSLSNLQELYLDNNNLQGPIPVTFNALTNLQRLEMQSNKLNGVVPSLSSLKSLYYLDLSFNFFGGGFPSALPESLIQISMRNNSLSGALEPESLRSLNSLQVVDLSGNGFSGAVPFALFELPSLQQVTLSFNKFSQVEVPSYSLEMRSGVIAVDLSDNELGGFLPLFPALMPRLSSLSLENNKFVGMIPTQYALKTVFPEAGMAPFQRLLLGGNYLFGAIPSALMALQPGSAMVSLVDNCLYRCPLSFFFCQGTQQKSFQQCKRFSRFIP
ncbi:probable LRR receptor-like serine/threonine-protein kinase At4g36180 isoform X1 [Phaseolus vulgaris]|uniref:probable LRR receptor-like serine/threonine-protein kinase At4g36180 isoform X1 n=1 Tax=Phaseolus vulgaris TaxID=3885 RepID=UPI0035CB6746